MYILKAENRDFSTKAKHLRNKGFIPGNLYGGGIEESRALQIPEDEVKRLIKKKAKGGKVVLHIDGKNINALLRDIDRNPVKNTIEHLNFQQLSDRDPVTSTAQVVLVNREKVQAPIQQLVFDIPHRATPAHLMEAVEIDLDGMMPGTSIRVKDLDIAGDCNIELLADPDSLVLSVLESKSPVMANS